MKKTPITYKDWLWGLAMAYGLLLIYGFINEHNVSLLKQLTIPLVTILLSIGGFVLTIVAQHGMFSLLFAILLLLGLDLWKQFAFFRYRLALYLTVFSLIGLRAFVEITGGA